MIPNKAERDRRRAERERVRQINAPVAPGPDGQDHGMDLGQAALARGGEVVRVGGKIRGAAQRQAAPVYARMIDATDLFERMNSAAQLSDRQAKAGRRLLAIKRAAGIDPRVTARYPVTQDSAPSGDDDSDEVLEAICPEGFDPRTYHRWLLRQLPDHVAALLDRACDWTPERQVGHPGVQFLATFKVGLDRLADIFGIKDENGA